MARWPLYTEWPLYTGQLRRNYKATENFGKLSGDRDMEGDRSAGPSEVWLYQVKHAHDSAFQLDYTEVYTNYLLKSYL